MAIALDTTATGSANSGSPWTYSYTVTGSNPILWVGIKTDSSVTASAATWNTTETMTLVDSVACSATENLYLFVLANPSTGTHNVSVTISGNANLSHLTTSYTGASASGVPDAHKADTQTTNPTTVSLTTVAANCWVVALVRDIGGDTLTLNSGGVVRQNIANQTDFLDTNGPVSAGSNSFNISHGGAVQITTLIASFAPFVAPTNIPAAIVIRQA